MSNALDKLSTAAIILAVLAGCGPSSQPVGSITAAATQVPTTTLAPNTVTPPVEATATDTGPTPVPSPTLDPQFRTPTLSPVLPYWLSSDTSLAATSADSLGAPLPLGAVARVGLGDPTASALSPDARLLVVATETQVVMLRSDTLELLWAVHSPKAVKGIAWSPDGEQIVAWLDHDQRVLFLNPRTGGLLHVRTSPEWPADMAWSPDGAELALLYGGDAFDRGLPGAVAVLDRQGQTLRTFPFKNEQSLDIEWSPDGRLIAVSSNPNTIIFDSATGEQVLSQEVGPEIVRFNPQGSMLAVMPGWKGWDYPFLWDLQSGQPYALPTGQYLAVIATAWSPDGTRFLTGSSNTFGFSGRLLLWNAATHSLLHDFSDKKMSVFAASWSPDGSRIAAGGEHAPDGYHQTGCLVVWDANTQKALVALDLPSEYFRQILWLPDGQSFISAGVYSRNIVRWDAQTGEPLQAVQAAVSANELMWAKDGRSLVTNPSPPHVDYDSFSYDVASPGGDLIAHQAASDKDLLSTVTVSDAKSGAQLFSFTDVGYVPTMAWSPDGTLLAAAASFAREGLGGKVYIWDVKTKTMLFTLDFDARFVLDLAWSPDGTLLAGGEGYAQGGWSRVYEDPVLVWSVTDQKLLRRFLGHTGDVQQVLWSPDARLLASISEDGTALIWPVR